MPLINQFSPYSCALDCWANFLTENGYPVTTQQLLTHHRDICWHNPPNNHTYGSMDQPRFVQLASRYLCSVVVVTNPTVAALDAILKQDKQGILVFSSNHAFVPNLNHACRVIKASGNDLEICEPAFPYGKRISAPLTDLINGWNSTFLHVTIP